VSQPPDRPNEVVDPNTADLPDEAFAPIEGSPSPLQLEARIRARREQAQQDVGAIQSPHHDPSIEPLEVRDDGTTTVEAEELPEAPEQEAPPEPPAEPPAEEPEGEEAEKKGEEQPEVEEEDEDFYVGRYKSKEEAERGLAEKDKTIAQLFRERAERVGETQQQAQQTGEPQLDIPAWHEWASEAVENGDGMEGAMAALERGGAAGFDVYMAHWLQVEDEESRAQAYAFNQEVQRQYAAQTALAAVSPVVQQLQTNNAPNEAEAAKTVVAARYPDFNELQDDMDRLISDPNVLDDSTKNWLTQLAGQGMEGKARAWEYLYLTASATRAPQRAKAAKVERERRKTSADAAKVAAAVSSSEGSSVRTPLSEAELAVIRKKNGIRERAGLPLLPEE
jgi:hypothetical protein